MCLGDAVDQTCHERRQQEQEPQPPPKRPLLATHQLVTAEAAIAVEGAGYAPAATALMQLQSTVCAPGLLSEIDNHGRLITPRTKTGSNQRQRR